ncbi:hypothetical protein SCHPADRAFT_288512 [Schizopora paradoxa]|uniref:Uncharacterized protein n=1 Tax=Schizopora paradoxa TaxID=27342 RepID=A0A0H2RTU6_9AGAM|nr:hypothetical protein SCHPADRAFT_288512 [Schizopora paradoxa]
MAQQMSSYYAPAPYTYCGSAHSSTSNLIDYDSDELSSPPCTTPSLTIGSTAPSVRSFSLASGIDIDDAAAHPYRSATRDLAAAVMAALRRGETVDFDEEDYAADVLSLRSVQAIEQRAGSAAGHSTSTSGRRGATSPSPCGRVWMRSSKRSGRLSSRFLRFLRELRQRILDLLRCSSSKENVRMTQSY